MNFEAIHTCGIAIEVVRVRVRAGSEEAGEALRVARACTSLRVVVGCVRATRDSSRGRTSCLPGSRSTCGVRIAERRHLPDTYGLVAREVLRVATARKPSRMNLSWASSRVEALGNSCGRLYIRVAVHAVRASAVHALLEHLAVEEEVRVLALASGAEKPPLAVAGEAGLRCRGPRARPGGERGCANRRAARRASEWRFILCGRRGARGQPL
jgi:hypothetical protein